MPVALDRAALQFQSPGRAVDIAYTDPTYTLRRHIGNGRYWAVDLTGETVGDYFVRSLAAHRIEGTGATTLGTTGSAWERAHNVTPSGGTGVFIGTRAHGYERDDSITVTLDGETVTPNGTPQTGLVAVIERTSTFFHPDAGDSIGTGVTTYTMTREGLQVDWSITWSVALTAAQCYGAMFPNLQVLDTGKTTNGAKATLTANDNSVNSSSESNTAWLWDADGNHGACMTLLDVDTVFSWGRSDSKDMWIQDRSDGSINKIYAGFTGGAIAAGETWTGSTRYMADHFGALAATTLDF